MRIGITIMLEKSYSESCLPKTIKRARTQRTKRVIESDSKFSKLPTEWEFEDRLLVFLAPCFKEDIRNYRDNSGNKMVDIFTEIQLQSLDRELSKLLEEYLNQKKR